MNFEQIKQIRDNYINLLENNEGLISITTEGKVLIREKSFKKLVKNEKYDVFTHNKTFFYETEIDGCTFISNSETPLFDGDLKLLQEQKED